MMEEGQQQINMDAVVQEALTFRTAERLPILVNAMKTKFAGKVHDFGPTNTYAR